VHSLKVSGYAACLAAALLVVTNWASVQGQAAPGAGQRPAANSAPKEKDLLYVAVPGTAYLPSYRLGVGILVFDVKNNFEFVKRIATWDFPASQDSENVVGIAVSPATGLLYLSTGKRLAAFDLITEKMAWEQTYDGQCCEMMALSPDGQMMYVPSDLHSHWYVVDAKTGALITKIEYPKIAGTHNTIWSRDGSRVFMSGAFSNFMVVANAKTHTIVQTIGPFSESVRPFTVNGRGTLLFANMVGLDGFEVADTKSGKVLHRVEVAGDWKERIKDRNLVLGHGTPSHGVAMSPDEKEIWVTDGVGSNLHVFDATVMPPKQVTSVKTRIPPYWVTFGLDGKYVFAASGDVIDAATKKIVAGLKDEFGRAVSSEKQVECLFVNGKLMRAVDRFGIGQVRTTH
jgi:DNA-binding beta-propeller fold protein YncE